MSASSVPGALSPDFAYSLRTVTETAARAAADWIGRGEKNESDRAAVKAMRTTLNEMPMRGVIVIGEGEKDEAPALYNGEEVGSGDGSDLLDIAVDPVEGTTYLAKGMTNAMAVIAVAPRGAMMSPGPAFYMEKLAAPAAAKGAVDPRAPVEDRLHALSRALDKPVSDLTIYVLEKPRHRDLVDRIYRAGARVALYPAGDVAGALMAATPNSGVDALMGTGGTPEGIISACAIRALGGVFCGRLDPQLPTEIAAVSAAGMNTERWYDVDELVTSGNVVFCATGITTGLLFEGVERTPHHIKTQTLMIAGPSGERQVLTTYTRLAATA